MSANSPGGRLPFADLRVLDFSQVLAGPYVGRLLAELGADVIKIESPSGDLSRVIAPKHDRGMSGLYTWANVGKRNLCLDLSKLDARSLALELTRSCDAVIENFRPGVAQRLGIGWDAIHAANARTVMLSISGFGHDSSLRERGAFAPTIHAATGLLEYQARKTGLPVRPLADARADLVTALHAMIALTSALRVAERTGLGERVELAMYDSVLATYPETPFELLDPPEPRLEPAPFDAGDNGWIVVAGPPQFVWLQLTQTFREISDPAPAGSDLSTKARLRHAGIEAWMAGQRDCDALIRRLEEAGLSCAPVQTLREALTGPFARERELLTDVDDRRGGTRPIVRLPYRFSHSAMGTLTPAPRRGEHNREILAEVLGLKEERIRELESSGVLLAESPDEP